MTEKLSCENCKAACCKGTPMMVIELAADEAAQMREAGTDLMTVVEPKDHGQPTAIYPVGARLDDDGTQGEWELDPDNPFEPLKAGMGRYMMIGACGNLVVNKKGHESCGIYETRPAICAQFPVGSERCVSMRLLQGVPTEVPLIQPVMFRQS